MNETKIRWEDNVPVSEEYDDLYFSKENGMEESCYVFLQGNKLEDRWKNNASPFTIIETGFGTGLNFANTYNSWKKINNNNNLLQYISIEKSPLEKDDLKKSLKNWGKLINEYQELISKYECKNLEIIKIDLSNVKLTILFEDIKTALPKIKTKANAWFLDGFSPSKNPDMWNDDLYAEMKRLSKTGTTFATFTSAGFVRRGLIKNGFDVKKIKGFGKKREMLIGHFEDK